MSKKPTTEDLQAASSHWVGIPVDATGTPVDATGTPDTFYEKLGAMQRSGALSEALKGFRGLEGTPPSATADKAVAQRVPDTRTNDRVWNI